MAGSPQNQPDLPSPSRDRRCQRCQGIFYPITPHTICHACMREAERHQEDNQETR